MTTKNESRQLELTAISKTNYLNLLNYNTPLVARQSHNVECSLCNEYCQPEFVGLTRQIDHLRLCQPCFERLCRWFSITRAERQVTR